MPEVQPGDRVELVSTTDPYTLMRRGDRGTVTHVDFLGTIHVEWDSGSKIGLLPGIDEIRPVTEEE